MPMRDAAIAVDHRFYVELAGLVRAANQWARRDISAQDEVTSAVSISSELRQSHCMQKTGAPKANSILAVSPPMIELLWGHILADLQMKWCRLKVLTKRQDVNTSCLLTSGQYNGQSDGRSDRTQSQVASLKLKTCNAVTLHVLDAPSDPASCL